MDKIAQKISETVDDLGLQLDILYRLPQKNRQFYLQKINTSKSTLLALKSNLRQNNQTMIQRQFDQTSLSINQLKKQLNDLVRQNMQNHQNRLNTKLGQRKGVSSMCKNNYKNKEYEELMKNLVQKTSIIQQLNSEIKNSKEKQTVKSEQCQTLRQQNSSYQVQIRQLTMQNIQLSSSLSSIYQTLRIKEEELEIVKVSDRNNMEVCDKASLQIHCLNSQLILARQKLQNFEQLAQMNILKAKIVEQNLQKMQKQAECLNKQYQRKQSQYLKKINNLQKCNNNNQMLQRQNQALQKQIQRSNQDIKIIQIQLNRFQQGYYQMKNKLQVQKTQHMKLLQYQTVEMKQKYQTQKSRYIKREQTLERQCYNLETIIIKEEQNIRNLEDKSESLNTMLDKTSFTLKQRNKGFQELNEKYQRETTQLKQDKHLILLDLEIQKKQYAKLSQQIRKTLELNRKLQQQLQSLAERHRNNQKNRCQEAIHMKQYQIICQQNRKSYTKLEDKYKELNIQNQFTKESMQLLQNKLHICQNQLKQTKIRLHKAKIQTIHDLRTALF